jgi:hypothetical protein
MGIVIEVTDLVKVINKRQLNPFENNNYAYLCSPVIAGNLLKIKV